MSASRKRPAPALTKNAVTVLEKRYLRRDQEGKVLYMDERGAWEKKPRVLRPYQFPYIASEDVYKGADWLKEAVCYQIFPDRFHRGEGSDQVIEEASLAPWGARPTTKNHFGGNIKGITEKIPYLKDLGVNAGIDALVDDLEKQVLAGADRDGVEPPRVAVRRKTK